MANSLTKIKTNAIDDDAVTLAKQAAGTDGQIITYDASGNPTAVGPGTDGQVLTSTGAGSPPAFEDAAGGGASLANDGDNRVVTATGSGGINGEANLVFDGTNLGVGCTPSRELHVKGLDATVRLESTAATGRNVLEFYDSSAGKGSIGYPSSGNDNFAIQQSENAAMWFSTNDTERLRLDSSGRLLLGTTTEGAAAGDNFTLEDSGDCGITIRSGTSDNGLIYFSDATSSTGEYAGYIQYTHGSTNTMYLGAGSATRMEIRSGDVKINNGNLLMGTAGTGINFSATSDGSGASNVAEVLDDYEEGTFTPTIRANLNTNGSQDGTASYVKIGKKVHIHVHIGNKTLTGFPGSGPGTIRIDGLPFVSNQAQGDEFGVSSKCIIMGVDNNSNNVYFRTQNGESYLLGYYNQDGSTWAAHDAGFWDNSGVYCIFNLTYFTNS